MSDINSILDSIRGIELFYQIITTSEIGLVFSILAYLLLQSESRIAKMLKEFVRSKLDFIVSKKLEEVVLKELKTHEDKLKDVVRNELNTNNEALLEEVVLKELKMLLQELNTSNEATLKSVVREELRTMSWTESYRKRSSGNK